MKFYILTIIITIVTTTINAQQKSDISLVYNTTQFNRLNIDYRLPIKEIYKLRFGVNIGTVNNYNFFDSGQYIYASDSLITKRFNAANTSQFGLKFGIERQMTKNSIFSLETDFMVSYRNEKLWIYNTNYIFNDTTNNWISDDFYNNSYQEKTYDFEGNSKLNRKYIVPQVQLNFVMNLPIVEDVYLKLFVGGLVGFPILINESNKFDPNNEFVPATDIQTFEMTSQAGIGLGVNFGKEKVFTPKATN